MPHEGNRWHMFTRVIINSNPLDHNSTIFLMFDQPQYAEYVIDNNSEFEISYCRYD